MERNEKILAIIFTMAFTIFFINLNFNFDYSQPLYWISLLSMLGCIIYHIFKIDNPKIGIVLCEILVLNVCLHLIYQVGFSGLYGRDSYDDLKFLEIILYNNHFDLNVERGVSNWPNLHLLSAFMANVSGIDHFLLAKYFPTFFTCITVMGIYLLAKEMYDNYKVALLACLIFITIPKFVSFGSIFIREIFGIFAIIFCFYFIYASKVKDKRFTILSLLFIVSIVFSHHFSSFVFLVLILIFMTLIYLIPFLQKKNLTLNRSKTDINELKFLNINLQTIFFIILVILLGYWIYQAFFVWENVGRFVANLVTLGELPDYSASTGITTGIVTLRGYIIYYGFFLFFGLFGLILALKLFFERNKQKIEESTMIIFLLFCGAYGFISVFFLTSPISPDRMLTYGWLFGCIPLAAVLISLKNKPNILKKGFVVLIVAFMIFNIYNIPYEYFDKDFNVLGLANDKEYAIAETINLPTTFRLANDPKIRYGYLDVYYGYEGARNALYDKQNTLGENLLNLPTYKNSTKLNFTNSSSILIISEDYMLKDINIIKNKSPEQYQLLMQIAQFKYQQTNKIADLGSGVYVLTP